MALYTILSKTQIAKLLQRFQSLPPDSFRTKGIALGTVNTYYRITYKRGEVYYLKIDEIADELRLGMVFGKGERPVLTRSSLMVME